MKWKNIYSVILFIFIFVVILYLFNVNRYTEFVYGTCREYRLCTPHRTDSDCFTADCRFVIDNCGGIPKECEIGNFTYKITEV